MTTRHKERETDIKELMLKSVMPPSFANNLFDEGVVGDRDRSALQPSGRDEPAFRKFIMKQ